MQVTFGVIQNNQPVVDRISKINNAKKAQSIRTYDFSTLYIKIPHNLLKDAMKEIVDFCFKGIYLMGSILRQMAHSGGNLREISGFILNKISKMFLILS